MQAVTRNARSRTVLLRRNLSTLSAASESTSASSRRLLVGGCFASATGSLCAFASYRAMHQYAEDAEFRRKLRRDLPLIVPYFNDVMAAYFPHLEHSLRIQEDAEFGPDGMPWESPASCASRAIPGGEQNMELNLGYLQLPVAPLGDIGMRYYRRLLIDESGDRVSLNSSLLGSAATPDGIATGELSSSSLTKDATDLLFGNVNIGEMPPDDPSGDEEEVRSPDFSQCCSCATHTLPSFHSYSQPAMVECEENQF